MGRLEGNMAVVTGGLGAVGRTIVTRFLSEGARVAVPVRPGSNVRESFSGVTIGYADVTRPDEVHRFCSDIFHAHGRIDILVNAAGGYAGGTLTEDTTVSEWDAMIGANLTSTFLMCRAVLPGMRAQRYGRIVTFSAMAAVAPGARRTAYQVAKGGVITLTESIAAEVRGSGVTVNAIAPGIINTDTNRASMPEADSSRWVAPEEIADLVVYLCSPEAGSVSGNTVRIDGRV